MSNDPDFSKTTKMTSFKDKGAVSASTDVVTSLSSSPLHNGESGFYINKSIEAVDESILALRKLNTSIEKFLAQ